MGNWGSSRAEVDGPEKTGSVNDDNFMDPLGEIS